MSLVDRRVKPNYGYRAVHLIVKVDGKLMEIQVRTKLQHDWAELSEKLSDKIDPSIKYGGGNSKILDYLHDLSKLIKNYEKMEIDLTLTEDLNEEFKAK